MMPCEPPLPIRVVALYRFAPLAEVTAIRAGLERCCRAAGVVGTLLVAGEGINGTIAGDDAAIEAVLAHLATLPGCDAPMLRESRAAALPFRRLKVKARREIVTMGVAGLDPVAGAGRHVEPRDWNALIERAGTVVIDTRNDYEVAIGSFAGAVNPRTRAFADFPEWFRARRDELLGDGARRVAMFCTGGIRCEKATAFLRAEGVDEVYHLKGGVLAYLEQVPAGESRWQGECFVFDERTAVGQRLLPGSHTMCNACGLPVDAGGAAPVLDRQGPPCPTCGAPAT